MIANEHLTKASFRVLGDWQEWALCARSWTTGWTPAERAFLGRFALTGERKPDQRELAKLTRLKEKLQPCPSPPTSVPASPSSSA